VRVASPSTLRTWEQAARMITREERRRTPTRHGLVALGTAAAAWLAGAAGLRGLLHPSGEASGEAAGCSRAGAGAPRPGAAFAWPNRPVKKRQGPAKRSKQAMIAILQDKTGFEAKSKWAITLMKRFKWFTTTWEYVLAMKKLTQLGCGEEALELWDEMLARGIEPNPAAYTAAIVALDSGKQWQKAIALVDEMELHNQFPIRIGCEHALMACERGRLWQKAMHILDQMWEYGMSPNEDSFMPAIRTCENAGQFELGNKLFRQMRERTKLERVEDEMGFRRVSREPPKAPPAPWRLPGAVALDAFDPPKLAAPKQRPKKKLPQNRDA